MDTEEEEARAQVDEELVVVDDEEEELGLAMLVTTRWHAIAVGCVAIWPATVPRMRRHREVAFLALSVGNLLNPCRKAHVVEAEEIDRSGLVASASCMMTRVINTPSMMQDSCMCRWNLDRLLSMERMRRKMKNKQKTEKDLCQCSCCQCYTVFNWLKSDEKYKKFEGILSVPQK